MKKLQLKARMDKNRMIFVSGIHVKNDRGALLSSSNFFQRIMLSIFIALYSSQFDNMKANLVSLDSAI